MLQAYFSWVNATGHSVVVVYVESFPELSRDSREGREADRVGGVGLFVESQQRRCKATLQNELNSHHVPIRVAPEQG